MAIGINPDTFAVGHQWGNINPQGKLPAGDENGRSNWAKILGYFPILGVVICILRIIGIFEREKIKEENPFYQRAMSTEMVTNQNFRIAIRALCEFFSIGFLVFLADIVADIIRASE